MSELMNHARIELGLIESKCKDKESLQMQKVIDSNILEVLQVLCNQGHSGFTANYVIRMIKQLWLWKPISPLTGEEDEWLEREDTYQNKRCTSVFKDKKSGKAYWLDGYAYCEPFSDAWFTCRESKKYIEFPCDPNILKTEHRKLLFPSKYVPIKWANRLHLYRVV